MALYLFTWYHRKVSCRFESPRLEFTPVLCTGARISLRYEISHRYHVNAKRPRVSVWNRSAGRREWVARASCLRFWITRVFYQHEVYLQITRYEMTSHHVKVIRNKKVIPVWDSHLCEFSYVNTPFRLRKTSPFAVKSIPSFTNFKKSFKTFRLYQSSLRLIYLNPLTRFSRSYALIIKERARALRSLHCLRNTYRCKNIWLWHQRTSAWPYRLGIG